MCLAWLCGEKTLGSLHLVLSGLHPPQLPFFLCWFCFVSFCYNKSYLWLQKEKKKTNTTPLSLEVWWVLMSPAPLMTSFRSTSSQQKWYTEGEWVQGKTKNSWSLGSSWFISLNPHNNLVEKWELWIIKRLKSRTILGVLLSLFTNKRMEDQRVCYLHKILRCG